MRNCNEHKIFKIVLLVLIGTIFLFSLTACGGAGGNATPEQMIDDFSKLSFLAAEKKLGNKFISYDSGVSYEYATYKGLKYDEIRLFYDINNHDKIQDIDFIMDYSSNKQDIDNLIWSFNQKYGTPNSGTSKAKEGSFDYNYYSDSDGNVVAAVKIYDYGKAEVDYYYSGCYEPHPLKLFDLNAETDMMTVLRSVDHYYKTDSGNDYIKIDFGEIYMFDGQTIFSTNTVFYFNKADRKFTEFNCDYEPYYYSGQDATGRAISDLMYSMEVQSIHDTAVEKWGNAVQESKSYPSGIQATEYTWNADGITLTINYNSNRSFLYYKIID